MAQRKQQQAKGSGSAVIPHWYDPEGTVSTFTEGKGALVYDDAGDEYLDFLSMLYCANAGHGDERIAGAIADQASRLAYVSPSKHNDTRSELAERLVSVAPDSLTDVCFSVTGSEANETAVQFAREYTGAQKVLTRWHSYHGWTYGAASLTGDPQTRAVVERHAATTGAVKFLPPLVHRSPFDGDTEAEIAQQAADHLEFVIRNEGPDSIAAILTEVVAGSSGAFTAPAGYFERVREICDEYDILLIADEVITGFGRCGDWFAVQTEGIEPDMLTFAKAATSGYVPLGGVLVRPEIAGELREDGVDVGQTFGGHPVGCAAALAAMDRYEDDLLDNVRELSPVLESTLRSIERDYEVVGDVHGRGFLWGVEFTDPDTGEPFFDPRVEDDGTNPLEQVREVVTDRGVLVGSGRPDFQIILAPPFCIDEADIERVDEALRAGIDATFG